MEETTVRQPGQTLMGKACVKAGVVLRRLRVSLANWALRDIGSRRDGKMAEA